MRKGAAAVTVLMLEIDHFTSFNDQHGHAAGDVVLRMVGRPLTESVKGRDVVARYGGEEFMIILPCTPLAQAAATPTELWALVVDSENDRPRLR